MRDNNQRRKKIAAGQQQEFTQAKDRELTKEQNCGREIGDEYNRLDGWNKTADLHHLLGREGRDGDEPNG